MPVGSSSDALAARSFRILTSRIVQNDRPTSNTSPGYHRERSRVSPDGLLGSAVDRVFRGVTVARQRIGMSTQPTENDDVPELPEVVPVLPLRNSVLFPGSIIPIDVGRPKSVKLIEEAIANERPIIGIVTQREARTEDPRAEDLHRVGCAARCGRRSRPV